MAERGDLKDWVVNALKAHGGRASIVEVSKYVWDEHEGQLRNSADLFFTWQYDIRWAATQLRKAGVIRPADVSPTGIWELARM